MKKSKELKPKVKVLYCYEEEPGANQVCIDIIFEGKKYGGYLPRIQKNY